MNSKRQKYLSWDQFFISVAQICAMRSKDPNTQVGSCVINNLNQIVATGYNGLPCGLDDDVYPWGNEEPWLDSKYPYVAHAELNAIVSARKDLTNHRIYTTLFPCNECVKIIIQSGIKEVVYASDKYEGNYTNIAAKKMLNDAKIAYRQFDCLQIEVKY